MLPARYAQIAFVLPASRCLRTDGLGHSRLIGDYYVEINDGLGLQARDSGTADVHRAVPDASQR